jgi:hypothetical protein
MIKKQQKWIALLVTLTFMWLLQVSTMPVAAAGTAEQVGSANADQGPDFVEAVGHKVAPVKKKSILPIVLIGVGVVAVAAVLFLVVLKTTYDIRGTWTVKANWSDIPRNPFTVVFTGSSKDTGTFKEIGIWNGTYMVDGKNVTWIYTDYPEEKVTYTGKFTDKDSITGTMTEAFAPFSGTFTATRAASATGIGNSSPGGLLKGIK